MFVGCSGTRNYCRWAASQLGRAAWKGYWKLGFVNIFFQHCSALGEIIYKNDVYKTKGYINLHMILLNEIN